VAVLQGTSARTYGTSILVSSLLFSRAGLPGTLRQIRESTDAGFETVEGRRCHKVVGRAAEHYPSGAVTNVRAVTVWIDAETLLIRRVFEDTPEGYPGGAYLRRTVTIQPSADPPLGDERFAFEFPPGP
jgi:hypothetical protein